MNHEDIHNAVQEHGLFVCKLNNGDWMVGRASYIYHIEITQDHYTDPNLSISPNLSVAVVNAVVRGD